LEIILTRVLAGVAIYGVLNGIYLETQAQSAMHQILGATYIMGGAITGALVLAISRLHKIQISLEKASQPPKIETPIMVDKPDDSKSSAWAALKG
jgi:hypothetical protein